MLIFWCTFVLSTGVTSSSIQSTQQLTRSCFDEENHARHLHYGFNSHWRLTSGRGITSWKLLTCRLARWKYRFAVPRQPPNLTHRLIRGHCLEVLYDLRAEVVSV